MNALFPCHEINISWRGLVCLFFAMLFVIKYRAPRMVAKRNPARGDVPSWGPLAIELDGILTLFWRA